MSDSFLTDLVIFQVCKCVYGSTFSPSTVTSDSYRHLYAMHLKNQFVQAFKRELNCVTFCHTFRITSVESWSMHLKLIPIALSLILTSFRKDTSTMSESAQFCNACSHKIVTLAIKWETGSLSSPTGGGNKRTVCRVPTVLNRLHSSNFVNYRKFSIHGYSENNTYAY